MSSRRPFSPSSADSTATSHGSSVRVVTKLALEGRAKSTGASVKLYLKLSIPVDVIVPGMPVPLFPEESLKIVGSAVHPLDFHNVPYSFSSSTLLQASRSLGLPNRSSKSYLSLFPSHAPDKPLDDRLTGHISVVDYRVSYILPKEFPPQYRIGELPSLNFTGSGGLLEKNVLNFMAAVDMVLSFQSAPPFAPYTIVIPIPRCLSNTVKLQIHPPTTAHWDVSTTPHISPRPPSSPKSVSSSVSSVNSEFDELVINGSFPSASHFIVRFALPDADANQQPGRRKVGVRDVSSVTRWRILERSLTTIKADVACDLKIKGIWYAGVATLLGMDIALESSLTPIEWPEDIAHKWWDIQGSLGFTGFGLDSPRSPPDSLSRSSSRFLAIRTPSTSSLEFGQSLLQAPLPQSTDLPDFSFENHSPSSSRMSTPTSSLAGLATNSSRPQSVAHPEADNLPSSPLVLHLNMADLGSSDKNTLECQIYGQVVMHANEAGQIILPSFQISTAAMHRGEVLLQSDVDDIEWLSDRAREPILLKKAVTQRCVEGTTLILRNPATALQIPTQPTLIPPPHHTDTTFPDHVKVETPSTSVLVESSSPFQNHVSDQMNLDTEFIPHVHAIVIPLLSRGSHYRCAVKVRLPRPPPDRRHIEFGLASNPASGVPSAIQLVSSTVGDISVDAQVLPGFESVASVAGDKEAKEWICWIKLDLQHRLLKSEHFAPCAEVEVVYLIGSTQNEVQPPSSKGKRKKLLIEPPLPCFAAKVGVFDVLIEDSFGWEAQISRTNLAFQSTRGRLISFALGPYFFPVIALSLRPQRHWDFGSRRNDRLLFMLLGCIFYAILSLIYSAWPPMLSSIPINEYQLRQRDQSEILPPTTTLMPVSRTSHGYTRTSTLSRLTFPSPSNQSTPETYSSSNRNSQSPDLMMRESGSDFRLRLSALMSLASVHANRFYNHETKWMFDGIHQTLSHAWKLCIRLWNWPLPP